MMILLILSKLEADFNRIERNNECNIGVQTMDNLKTIEKGKEINISIIAYLIIAGFFALLGMMIFQPLPEGSSEAIFLLFGALASGFGAVVNYFFGSSKSSNDKTKLMSNGIQPKKML